VIYIEECPSTLPFRSLPLAVPTQWAHESLIWERLLYDLEILCYVSFVKCPTLIGICGSSSRLLWLHIDKLYYFICWS